MTTITISSKYQIVIPKEIRERAHLAPRQKLHMVEKNGSITLIPDVPLTSLRGIAKGMSSKGLREKKDRI